MFKENDIPKNLFSNKYAIKIAHYPKNKIYEMLLIHQSINQSIIYFNTLRQRDKKLVQNTNVYK